MAAVNAHDDDLAARPHVLVVDDDARISELVSRYLTDHGFIVMTAESAAEARQLLKSFEFDVMVVDVMMPGETGLEFTKDIRGKLPVPVPVLLLTALGEAQDRITGLETGADDYLSKPFEPRELVLRLQSILRRAGAKRDTGKPFKIGRWVFDPEHGELQDGTEIQKLTAAEINLVRALAARPREVISREELAQKCGLESGERTIDVQVTRLRRKIEADTKVPRFLLTVRGKGYMLRTEEI
jgi:two-component system, OmpR family, phosphate regulon response regulator OmpR